MRGSRSGEASTRQAELLQTETRQMKPASPLSGLNDADLGLLACLPPTGWLGNSRSRRGVLMAAFHQAIPLMRAKGWNLYKGIPGVDLRAIVAQGKSITIEPGSFYHVLPVAFRDRSFEGVTDHLADAHHTRQMPVYNDRVNPPSVTWRKPSERLEQPARASRRTPRCRAERSQQPCGSR